MGDDNLAEGVGGGGLLISCTPLFAKAAAAAVPLLRPRDMAPPLVLELVCSFNTLTPGAVILFVA